MAQMSALTAFNPNTTIVSADTNSNNTTIRSTYNTHDSATTSVHGVTGTIVGTSDSQNLTNKTITSPVLSGIATGTYTLAGAPTITSPTLTTPSITSGHLNLTSAQRVIFNASGDSDVYAAETSTDIFEVIVAGNDMLSLDANTGNAYFSGSSGTFFLANSTGCGINENAKFWFDGTGLAGDTFITSPSANRVDLYIGASQRFIATTTFFSFVSCDLSINDGQKIYYDGGNDSFREHTASNVITDHVGGTAITDIYNAGFRPAADNTFVLGAGGFRWTDIYAVSGSVNTSDARQKKDIEKLPLGLEFINKLNPVSYKWKEGKDTKTKHYGFIAQELENVLFESCGIIDYSEKEDIYGVRYHELIAPMVVAIKEISQKINSLERAQEK